MFDARPQDNTAVSLPLVTSDSDKLEVYQLQFGCSRPCCLGARVLWDCDDSDEFAREHQALIKLV